MTGNVSGPYGPTTPQVRLPAPILKTIHVPPVEAEYLRVRPFLALSGWSKSTLYRLNQRHSLLIKVDHATFVDLKAWRKYMATCPRVGRAR
jgi:hypothetical protein